MNLSPLLSTLSKVSGGRILPDASVAEDGELRRATIPVVQLNTGAEHSDATLRSYAKDWLALQSTAPVRVTCTFEPLESPKSWRYDDGKLESRPVVAVILLSWWPKPVESESWGKKPRPEAPTD